MRYKDLNIRRLDKDNIVVERINVRKKGNNIGDECSTILGYYTSVEGACKGLVKNIKNDVAEECHGLAQFLVELEAVSWDVTRKLKEMCDKEGVE